MQHLNNTDENENKNENENFYHLFRPYKIVMDKHKSLYIFIVNNIAVEEVIEKIKRMIIIIDSGSNPSKNAYRKNRLSIFLTHLTGIKPESIVDGLFLLGTTLDKFSFNPFWRETLELFGQNKFIEFHDDYFDIELLKNLLLDRSYINVLHFKNNTLKHIHLNKTKKRIHCERTERNMDVNAYIVTNKISQDDVFIVHGVSSFLRSVTTSETNNIYVLNGDQKDNDILATIERIENNRKSQLLKSWLDKMSDIKEGHKLVFGSEIKENIENQMLHTIFVSPERAEKMVLNFPDLNLMDKMVIIKSIDSDDLGYQLAHQWKGAIGIKYY